MSRNGQFRLHSPMGENPHMSTSYGPAAEGSSEGDILYGLREDDANLRLGRFRALERLRVMDGAYAPDAESAAEGDILYGLREDDANLRLGVSAYDLRGLREDDANLRLGISAYDMRGLREDDANMRLGVSAYDLRGIQPGMLRSDGRMGGLVEDHWGIEMGVSAYDMRGLREDDANLRLGDGASGSAEGYAEDPNLGVSAYDMRGLREDDANLRLGVSAYDLRGLREDDANLRLGTAYGPDASGSAEDPASRAGMGISAYDLQGLREDDANVRLGISAYDLGDVDSLNAEAGAIEQQQTLSDYELGTGKGMKLRNVIRNAARMAHEGAVKGTITSYAEAQQFITEKARIAANKMKAHFESRRNQVDKVMNEALQHAMAEWGPKIQKALNKKVSVAGVRMGMILRGLREDDANIDLGRRRHRKFSAYKPGHGMFGAEGTPPELLNATGFHERFPVSVNIEGLGRITAMGNGEQIQELGTIFDDIFGHSMTFPEFNAKCRVIADQWSRAQIRLDRLAPVAQDSIKKNMEAAGAGYGQLAVTLPQYIAAGEAGWALSQREHNNRVLRWEAYMPTLDKLISQAEVMGTAYTPQQANADALKDVTNRANAAGTPTFLEQAAPIAAGAAGVGLLTALIIAIA